MLSNKVYDVLKFVTQVALPAFGVFYAAMAQVWGFPFPEEIPATIGALILLLGSLLQISTIFHNAEQAKK